jgi:hypothetical protein
MNTRQLFSGLLTATFLLAPLIGQGSSLAQKGVSGAANIDVNANKAYNQIGDTLGSLGIVGTGVQKETDDVWCIFNDWQARDRMKTKYKGSNINFKTTFGGTWFCVMKR